ncbi:hypothetical protein S101468_01394 [Acetobacter pasteurianus subsp. pasteurianus]|uniref:Uncharacterized protein n=1 Tax=Acetobacter pasteurianus subsp. pasteurianus TaxID=481145 RepID=A0AAC9SQN5_ACEPA|nr:hypothetical protein [Acetobacter pasteurianus]ASC05652.1 hypothetical protein S101468_01394 [Acetobacter pasteurianus subsp. pasteurianus]
MTETRSPFNGKKKEPVGGELEIVGYADKHDLPLTHEDDLPTYYSSISSGPEDNYIEPLVRQSDAQAKLAERGAEITRLNQKITKLKDIIARAMIQSCLHGADGDIGRLRRVEAELEVINTLNSSEGMIRENCP